MAGFQAQLKQPLLSEFQKTDKYMLQNMVFSIFDALWRMQGYDKKHGKDEEFIIILGT